MFKNMREISEYTAVVHCAGGCLKNQDGVPVCGDGCIGCGACVKVCARGAVELMRETGTAHVNRELCAGCGACVKACPQSVIHLELREDTIMPLCSNRDDGKTARGLCLSSCIGCGICEKNCPTGAVRVIDRHAVIDQNFCIACGMCAVRCPRGVMHDAAGILAKRF